jgi:hypothetical protein
LSNFTAEAWGFLCLQFFDIFDAAGCGTSIRLRHHRVIESGLVIKAARVSKHCTILRFETKIVVCVLSLENQQRQGGNVGCPKYQIRNTCGKTTS